MITVAVLSTAELGTPGVTSRPITPIRAASSPCWLGRSPDAAPCRASFSPGWLGRSRGRGGGGAGRPRGRRPGRLHPTARKVPLPEKDPKPEQPPQPPGHGGGEVPSGLPQPPPPA